MRIAKAKLVMAMAAALSVVSIPAFGSGPDAPQAPAAPQTRPSVAPTPAPAALEQLPPAITLTPEAPPPPAPAVLALAPEPPEAAGQPTPAPAPEPPSEPVWVQASQSYLGVDTRDISKERMTALKLKEERGVEIILVDHDAPAGKAGLKVGDVILEFNGQRLESQEQLRRLIREIPPGRTVTLGISREGQPMSIQATLGDRRKLARGTYTMAPMPPMPPIRVNPRINVQPFSIVISDRTGLLVENLTPQLGEFFGVKNGEGVLVRSVEKGSVAETAGFRAGDVIVKVGEKRIARISDWRNAIRGSKGTVAIGVVRDKKDHALSLALPERPAGMEEDSSFHFEWPEGAFEFQFDDIEPQLNRLREHIAITARHSAELSATEAQRAMRQAQRELDRELRRLKIELERETALKDREQRLEQKKKVLEKEKEKRKTEEPQ